MIRITDSGVVEYATKIEGVTWRTTITPGDTAEATKYLDADELAQVEEVWTPELVQRWIDEHPAPPPRTTPRPPRVEDKVAQLEAVVLELTERLEKLETPVGVIAPVKGAAGVKGA